MKKVSFEPQAWNELGFNWNEYVWSEFENPCSPKIDMLKMNTVSINVPEKNPRKQKRRRENSCSDLRVFLSYRISIL
ncbi:MAG: hypothetical protein K2I95_11515 [Treponemataceae bacterium]|nr:hypothetical protein [Treponemataceae bacterium]